MEKFCLKTVDYQTNISKSFQNLRNQDDFCDVTLVGEDFKQVTAHKVVLSSCSEYFKTILRNNKSHASPMLCLNDLNQKDLNNILDYIYMGELQIYQEEIDRFLDIAQKLKLHGLSQQGNPPGAKRDEKNDVQTTLQELMATPDTHYNDTKIQPGSKRANPLTKAKIAAGPFSDDENKLVAFQEKRSISLISSNFESIGQLNEKIDESYFRNADGMLTCRFCSKTFKQRVHIKEHVEIHIEGLSFPCNICGSTFTTRNVLRGHFKRSHGI